MQFCTYAGSKAKLTVVPENIAVVEGNIAILNCATDNDNRLIWKRMNVTHLNAALSTLYTGTRFRMNYASCCEISSSRRGKFSLKVKTRKGISLHYLCEDPGVENSGADLVILGKCL